MRQDGSAPGTWLVGRQRERATLRASLTAVLSGRGHLVLLSGDAGVGKTALADAVCAEARERGARVLVGRCYDLTATPPYDPWMQIGAHLPQASDRPSFPDALDADRRTPQRFFTGVRDALDAAAAQQPLVLLLDDVQWADRASLDLLRYIARSLGSLPILLLALYRPDDLTRTHPLYPLLPLLVRESDAVRLDLAPLTRDAIADLVRRRYRLATFDAARLVAFLWRRTEGNALFATELLHALHERDLLATEGTVLGEIETIGVPPLLRQLVEGRVARLGAEAERLLGIAAVIGQEVPPALWADVSEIAEERVEQAAERAVAARLLRDLEDGARYAFAHALIREALYESIPGAQRRRLHLRIAETLAAMPDPAPDMIAYHFRHANDPRMVEWTVRAGWLAYRASAYHMARARFAEVRRLVDGAERVRVLLALAFLDRYRERGVAYAEEALAAARATGDAALIGQAQFHVGANLGYRDRVAAGLTAMAAADTALAAIPEADVSAPLPAGLSLSRDERASHRAWLLAYSGHWREALALLGATPESIAACAGTLDMQGRYALWFVCALLCRPDAMRRVIEAMIARSEERGEDLAVLATRVAEGYSFLPAFFADDPVERQRFADALARATQRVEASLGTIPPLLNSCPLLVLAGRWDEASALWERRGRALVNSGDTAMNLPYIGAMYAARGDSAGAWALVREGLPDGPETAPGTTHFNATVRLLPLAVRLALHDGDHVQARAWLEAADRYFAWLGPEVRWGRAETLLAWAEYHGAAGAPGRARSCAEEALAIAGEPRQPLALLAAHRTLGTLHTAARRYAEAATHLDHALTLAAACAMPYEQALAALAAAEHHRATGNYDEARRQLGSARSLGQRLGAQALLARVGVLAGRLAAAPVASSGRPAGLTAREAEVLRLVARGWTAREVAAHLSLSPRTVSQHLRSIYNKLGVSTRAAATRFAVLHGIA